MSTYDDALPLCATKKINEQVVETDTKSKKKTFRNKEKLQDPQKLNDNDDFAGLIVNAGKSINVREMIIIWLWFLIVHSEIFIMKGLSKIPGAVDANQNMTLSGTFYTSIIMIIGIVLIDMIYR
jgi:hypothetical protein